MMTRSKTTYGIVTITTIVLMFATTLGSAINNADAQRGPDRSQEVNQRNEGITQDANQRGLVNVGNVGVEANVAVPVQAQVCAVIAACAAGTR